MGLNAMELASLQRLRVKAETTFGTDMTAAGTSFTGFVDLPILEGSLQYKPGRQRLPLPVAQQYRDNWRKSLFGKKMPTLSFTTHLPATGTAADASTSSITGPLGVLLKAMMGVESLSAGTAVASGGTTSAFNATAAQGSRVPSGTAVAILKSGAIYEAREVLTQSTDAITLAVALTNAASGTVYRSATYKFDEDISATLQFVIQGKDTKDSWVFMGCAGGFSLNAEIGAIPTITWQFVGVDQLGFTATLGAASHTAYSPVALIAGDMQFYTFTTGSAATLTQMPAQKVTIGAGLNVQPIPVPAGIQSVYTMRSTRNVPVTSGTITTWYDDAHLFSDARDNGTMYGMALQIGTTPGSIVLITQPSVQIVDWALVDNAGIRSQMISTEGKHNEHITSPANATQNSPLGIHLL